jgi:putative PIN family toxin of toxin-antitoxin system
VKHRVVIDTSTLVSAALRADSKPRRTLEKAIEHFELCLSELLLSELEMVLARPPFLKYASAEAIKAFIESLRADASIVPVNPVDLQRIEPKCRDAEDNHILALAQVARADLIVSSDNDLLTLHPWNGIFILTPAQFLDQLPD